MGLHCQWTKTTRRYSCIFVLMQLSFNESKVRYIGKIIIKVNEIAVIE